MKVSLFVTCIVDQMFPGVGVAAVEVLSRLGVEVTFNSNQTCCGQPAFNTGYRKEARQVALSTVDLFERELRSCDYIVAPSGSCVTMVRKFYRELFESDPAVVKRAEAISLKIFELSDFLVNVLKALDIEASYHGRVTYHDCCHLLRELRISKEPRQLIGGVRGVEFVEMHASDACCGFGGTFSVKYPEISTAIDQEKITNIARSGADTVVACDSSCLMQIAGLAGRSGLGVRCMHLAELLASREE